MNKLMLFFLILVVTLTACRSTATKQGPEAQATTQGLGTDAYGTREDEEGYESDSGYAGPQDAGPREGLLGKRVIYFDFDSARIRSEFVPIIEAHARYLASRPGVKVVLEGHTDERGSPEYNIALGEARAKSVAKAMELNGTSSNQINIVSYGEEKPVALGHDEASWSQNRRVEIVYREY